MTILTFGHHNILWSRQSPKRQHSLSLKTQTKYHNIMQVIGSCWELPRTASWGCKLVAMGTVLVGVLVGCILALVAVLVFGEDY
jgi:hypothetical protein